jgi:predicted 3-demethylubiquinone-9 3-methyltransferase (glyoxalase superfamily)
MPRAVTTVLMFDGAAEPAMRLYVELFRGVVHDVARWAAGEPGKEGTIKRATFAIAGHELVAFDSPVQHEFSFTPSISLFVDCADEAELDHAFARLAEGGRVLMPLGDYGFSRKFGWLDDRWGVSWQLDLKAE